MQNLSYAGTANSKGFDDFVDYTERMRKKYGDMFEIYFGPKRFIMLSKFEYMQNMFDYSLNSKYLRRIPYFSGLEELGIAGKGIALNHNVNVWKYNRHFISRALLTPSFSKSSVIWTQNLVEEMMGFWEDGSDNDGCFETDVVEWCHRFTTDSITHFTTGKRIHAIEAYYNELMAAQNRKPKKPSENDLRDASKFFKSIKTLIVGIYFFIIVPPWVRKYLPILGNTSKNHLKNRDWLFGFVDEIIKQRREEIECTPRSEPLRFDMLTSMITANTDRDICEIKMVDEEHTQPMNDELIRGILWETFVGGIDTTANMFSFVIYYLAYHPDVLKRLRVELDAFFKKMGDRRLDLESLSDLVYTDAIIKESFRMFTPAPYTARNSTAEDIVADRVWPEGTQYIINIHGVNHNEIYWDEPEKFDPDRYLNMKKSPPHIIFGGGRRVCPGRKLSFIELKVMIALVYHKLDIELSNMKNPCKAKFILIRSFHDLNVRIKPRKF
ncbi:17311_t:CDS:2 [Funneliformis caledonium]|uniref:17311_t:CDS:1 n=1 Tax=Funneliformis caledonium TaxID=1117310 RepID=A0A9N9FFE0_9GLOM|nr:17311_t:CDS:2 [Funneliformis caledonium]